MTLERAKELAAKQETLHVVYRFPKWPEGVYSIAEQKSGLPPEAEITAVKPISSQGDLFADL